VRNRPRPDRTRQSWLARAAAVLVTAAVLMTGPGIAQAAFTTRTGAQLSASTLNLSTLTEASVTVTCPPVNNNGNLKIQLTKLVDRANRYTITVKTTLIGYPIYSYAGELNISNQYTYQDQVYRYLPSTYEITAYYDVKVNGQIVNTWEGVGLSGSKTC
jgi:hypothetical protein